MANDNDIVWYLVEGFWKDFYDYPAAGRRKFDVAPGGTLTVNITGLTDEGKFLARHALAAWSEVTGIRFQETRSVNASIIFEDGEHPERSGPAAWSSFDSMSSGSERAGGIIRQSEVNVSASWLARFGTGLDSYSFTTYLHEIGHALGLGHPGDYNGELGRYNVGKQFDVDARLFTVMSYAHEETDNPVTAEFALNVYPATPMLADSAAIWELYGRPPGGVNAGDTIYTSWGDVPDVNSFQRLRLEPTTAVTIVDTGGRDTLRLGNTSDLVVFVSEEEKTVGVGSVNGAPVTSDGRAAFNLFFLGEVENLYGGAGDDALFGAGADNRLVGESGSDLLFGGGGADTFVFQPSDDVSRYTDKVEDFDPAQGDRIDLHAYRDITDVPENWIVQGPPSSRVIDLDGDNLYDIVLEGYTAPLDDNHFIFAGSNTSTTTATGTKGDDELRGTDGNDRLDGLAGDDTLVAWDGDDHLDGGSGDDVLEGGPGADTLVGGQGDDTASYLFSPTGVTVNLRTGTANGGDAQGDTLGNDIENVWGSAYDDVLTGTDSPAAGNFIYGLAGNDRLDGGRGDDILAGGEGADHLDGGKGNDILEGGPGADKLTGGGGADWAAYASSKTGVTVRLHSGQAMGGDAEGDSWGNLVTVRYTKDGRVLQETVPDIINLHGSDHDDVLAGDSRDNFLGGWDGNDKLYGGPGGGDDFLAGQKGDDALYGGLGDDLLVGGPGADRLVGGPGADEFRFKPGDSTVDVNDIIADFDPAQGDRIVLSGYERASFQDRYWVPDGSADTYVDLDGDEWSDIILLDYTEPLSGDHFILIS